MYWCLRIQPIASMRSSAGESVVVARGGRGGMGVIRPTREDNARLQSRKRRFLVSYLSNLCSAQCLPCAVHHASRVLRLTMTEGGLFCYMPVQPLLQLKCCFF